MDAVLFSPRKNLQITGGPGTGKTVILIHRAQWLSFFDETKYVVLIGSNSDLTHWMMNSINKLTTNVPSNLIVTTKSILNDVSLGNRLSRNAYGDFEVRLQGKVPGALGYLLLDEPSRFG